jgi:hypothetical protein
MILMPCDIHSYVIYPSINTFSVDPATNRVLILNGTQAVPMCPMRVGPSKISIGPCGAPLDDSDWRLVPAVAPSAPAVARQLQLASEPHTCAFPQGPEYHNSGGFVVIGD